MSHIWMRRVIRVRFCAVFWECCSEFMDVFARVFDLTHCNTPQYAAIRCNTLQHTATHCNTLQHNATLSMHSGAAVYCSVLQCIAMCALTFENAYRDSWTHSYTSWIPPRNSLKSAHFWIVSIPTANPTSMKDRIKRNPKQTISLNPILFFLNRVQESFELQSWGFLSTSSIQTIPDPVF